MTPERAELERRLAEATNAKRAAKGQGDDRAFVVHAREMIATLKAIGKLPEDNQLTDFQVGAYCWALYAIATKSKDGVEARQNMISLVAAYRRKIDSPQFWGDARGREFGRTLFGSIVVQLYKLVKEANDGAASTLLTAVARNFLEMLALRAEAYLDDAAFQKDPVTDAQRQRMEQSAGKRIRMKFWPSLAEKAFGLMNRCLKANEAIRPAPELVAFLGRNAGRGEWLGFYCANARVRIGDFSGARELLGELARRKRNEAWVWEHLAQAHQDQPTRAVGCLYKALICPIHDQEIAQAMVVRMHRQLARLWSALGRTEDSQRELERASRMEMPRANDAFYRREAASIEQAYLGTKQGAASAATDAARRFEGHLVKRTGNPFGFVTDKAIGPVFIPPRFADRLSNGAFIRGKAQSKEDKKKNRLSYCMISAL